MKSRFAVNKKGSFNKMVEKKKSSIHKVFEILISIIICHAAGIIGSTFTIKAIPTWYVSLDKPAFNPPNWIFGPVWLTLYTMMGISLYLVWRSKNSSAGFRTALLVFAIQLLLNAAWTPVFFGARMLFAGLLIIVLLWCSIIATIIAFFPVNRTSSILLVPYLLWVSFATILNYSLWSLNRGIL